MNTDHTDELTRLKDELKRFRMDGLGHEIAVEHDFICIYCGLDFLASFNNYKLWETDHIIPQSRDGEDCKENYAMCCRPCNYLKSTYVPVGNTRDERIVDARRFVLQKRSVIEAEVVEMRSIRAKMRSIVLAKNATPNKPNV